MRVLALRRIGAVLKGWVQPSASACGCLIAFLGLEATAQPSVAPSASAHQATLVRVSDQSAKDTDRQRILQEELQKTKALVEFQAKRKAERLAVGDMTGADDAEAQRVRAQADIEGLEREIAATRPTPEAPKGASVARVVASPTSSPPTRKAAPTVPWWDVYGKAPRAGKPDPVSFSRPSSGPTPHTDSTRLME
jgi:hypothetical protein